MPDYPPNARPAAAGLVSIVVPTVDEAATVGATLDAIGRLAGAVEVIVVDAGSSDATVAVARSRGARVLCSERGRGAQMRAGAAEARGDVLWFLHADTRPPPDGVEAIRAALERDGAVAGSFEIVFDGDRAAAKFLTWLYPRLRLIGLRYGDSGIFVRRDAYEAVGGFKPYPIFEDLDLLSRLRRRGPIVLARGAVVSSSRRFEGRSFALTFARWAAMQALYWLGVSPRRLGALYAPVRGRPKPS